MVVVEEEERRLVEAKFRVIILPRWIMLRRGIGTDGDDGRAERASRGWVGMAVCVRTCVCVLVCARAGV